MKVLACRSVPSALLPLIITLMGCATNERVIAQNHSVVRSNVNFRFSLFTFNNYVIQAGERRGVSISEKVASNLHEQGASVVQKLAGPKILWVDDNPGNNNAERNALSALKIQIDEAISTKNALTLLRMEDYNLVISDVGRGFNSTAGFDLLRTMRREGFEVPVIFYTDRQRPVPEEALALTTRPDELMEWVFKALEGRTQPGAHRVSR